MAADSGAGTAPQLLTAVTQLRAAVADASLPLDLPGAGEARHERGRLLGQLDDYLIPRLTSIDAPLLAVVGGSTGAGKSTLVNSIVGREVTLPGVLRPTTRSPVLVHHPSDARWFTNQRILPGLARITGRHSDSDGPGAVRLVSTKAVTSGLAVLDAPDIDSVVSANRDLAAQLLAAADLWIFVTTAARYADAVPWDLLREASERGTAIAVVLDRVAPESVDEIRNHLASMLREQGLEQAPIFTVTESPLRRGLLPTEQTEPLKAWLSALASDAQARTDVMRQTLDGALRSLQDRTGVLAAASDDQVAAAGELLGAARTAYADAVDHVREGMEDGTLLRGEVLARWQEFVGTGEFFRQVESRVSRMRDRLTAFVKGEPARAENLGEALQSGVADLIANRAEVAATSGARAWRSLPGGDQLMIATPTLARASADLDERIERLVRDWQGDILDLVRHEAKDRRTTARIMAYGVNGLGVVLMLVTFASTAGVTGAEVGIAGGTAVVGQKLLEAVFGDQAVRELARTARERLIARVDELYAAELARFEGAVASTGVTPAQSASLNRAAGSVRRAVAGEAPEPESDETAQPSVEGPHEPGEGQEPDGSEIDAAGESDAAGEPAQVSATDGSEGSAESAESADGDEVAESDESGESASETDSTEAIEESVDADEPETDEPDEPVEPVEPDEPDEPVEPDEPDEQDATEQAAGTEEADAADQAAGAEEAKR
ncbi:ABC transporter [Intrasporangium oryzae NRRL B-24470]|uniref:ABC transporter n=1 Tax=Intrasporangium oryzae NRRL B-24470 TaxID=1386089 RepID=W9G6S1_9MICO|nr:dynamin family protein [Intrasporangium oryzae]EWT00987.1 ABC transporter [Intrasporangium oryzae NRRL B-24470]